MKLHRTQIIYAMSRSQQDVAADIEQGCRELIMHLIKLWFYPDSPNKNHWRKEVAQHFNHVDTFKRSHKLPTKQFILEHSINVHRKFLLRYIDIVEDDYGLCENPRGVAIILERQIYKYFDWLAQELSTYPTVSYSKIYETLDRLGF